MKKLFIILICFFFHLNNGFAQFSAVDYTSDNFAQFKASKTYFVRTGNAAFDTEMEKAMKDYWKITSFDVIESKELDSKISDKSRSFILSIIIPGPYPRQNYHYIALINGGGKKLEKYGYESMLAYCPINHFAGEIQNTDCAFRVKNMMQSMIMAIDDVQKNDIKGNTKKIADKLKEQYNKRSPGIKDRTLLVCEDQIFFQYEDKKGPVMTKQEFGGLYPYKFEFVKKERLEQVIKEGNKDYYYLQLCSTLNHFVFVFDPSSGEVQYCTYSMSGMDIRKDDVKELVDAIKGKK